MPTILGSLFPDLEGVQANHTCLDLIHADHISYAIILQRRVTVIWPLSNIDDYYNGGVNYFSAPMTLIVVSSER